MKTEITRSTWEDVVFESRNKEYGAYAIRKSYDDHISRATFLMILFASFVLGGLQVASLMDVKIRVSIPVVDPRGFTNPPIVVPNPPAKTPLANAEQKVNRNLLNKVVTHEVELTPVKPIEVALTGSGAEVNTSLSIDGEFSDNNSLVTPVAVDPPKFTDFAEVMPVYEGGLNAMIKFLRKNLHYPSSARMTGIEGSVYIRFVIDGQGAVTDVEVIKGINGALDKEAIRVIAMMPRWKPGRQHNLPVNVRMVLPIKFKLEGE